MWKLRWWITNSLGDLENVGPFETLDEARAHIAVNGVSGHRYYYIQFDEWVG